MERTRVVVTQRQAEAVWRALTAHATERDFANDPRRGFAERVMHSWGREIAFNSIEKAEIVRCLQTAWSRANGDAGERRVIRLALNEIEGATPPVISREDYDQYVVERAAYLRARRRGELERALQDLSRALQGGMPTLENTTIEEEVVRDGSLCFTATVSGSGRQLQATIVPKFMHDEDEENVLLVFASRGHGVYSSLEKAREGVAQSFRAELETVVNAAQQRYATDLARHAALWAELNALVAAAA
jgi:hypothetical protein